jgi:hypothetical protein
MVEKRAIKAAIAAMVSITVGCGVVAAPASAQSLTDRFKSLFGGKSDEPAQTPASPDTPGGKGPNVDDSGLTCPDVAIRAGASTYAVATPGKEAVGPDVRFQVTITRTARQCSIDHGQITAKIGIQGRVIAGPAGAPQTVQVPLRVAVVLGGVAERTIATKAYQTTVNMSEAGSEPFTLVAEDLVYPAPPVAVADNYVFYVGFDPQILKPEPKPKPARKR